jgi:ligand-binding sensor domain-containing protein
MSNLTLRLTLVVFLLCPLASAQWIQTSGISDAAVHCFESSGANLLAGTDGGVYVSSNSGLNWILGNNTLLNTLVLDLAITETHLFAGTFEGVFLSTDNGTTWTRSNSGLTNTYVTALAVSGTKLFAGTFGGGVFLSIDNGTRWTTVSTPLTNMYIQALAISGADLFAGTGGGGVLRSSNDGVSWEKANAGLADSSIEAIAVLDSAVIVGTRGGVFVSTNRGMSWVGASAGPTDHNILSLGVDSTILFAGTMGGVFLSMDRGMNWRAVNEGLTSTYINTIAAFDPYLYAGSHDGCVSRRPIREMTTPVNTMTSGFPDKVVLHQNYPNPFNPGTRISYELPTSSHVRLSVYDVLGREVSVLVHERVEAGVHSVAFDASGLAGGVYFYRLQVRELNSPVDSWNESGRTGTSPQESRAGSREFTQTKRLVIVR